MKRMPLNARDARCCVACAQWHPVPNTENGECRHPKMRHGITYENPKTGETTHHEWQVSGPYHSCNNWKDKTVA
jgi:hypothetical protein